MKTALSRRFVGVVAVGLLLPILLIYTLTLTGRDSLPAQKGLRLVHKGTYHSLQLTNDTVTVADHNTVTAADHVTAPSTPSQPSALAEHAWRTCQKRHVTKPPQIEPSQLRHILVDDKHKVLYCYVPKVACTNWRRIFLVLTGQVKVNNSNVLDIQAKDVHNRYRHLIPNLGKFSKAQIRYRLDNYYKFLFVRDPFERLLSAWRNKFQSNMSVNRAFIDQYGPSIARYTKDSGNVTGKSAAKSRLGFDNFLRYLVDPVRRSALNEHWDKFSKLCLPCLVHYDFVGKYKSLSQDAAQVLRAMHADHIVSFPERSGTYKHQRTGPLVKDYYLALPPALLKRVYRTYQLDFEMFNYTVPSYLERMINAHVDGRVHSHRQLL